MADARFLLAHWGFAAFFFSVVLGNVGVPVPEIGALVYVPLTVGEGYAVGYGLGEYVARIHRGIVSLEQVLILGAMLGLFLLLAWQRRLARNHLVFAQARKNQVEEVRHATGVSVPCQDHHRGWIRKQRGRSGPASRGHTGTCRHR